MTISAQTNANALGANFVEAAQRALSSGKFEQVPDAELERVMTAAGRLYAAKVESEDPMACAVMLQGITSTDIVVTVSGLVRSAGLNLWDASMWFNRTKG